MFIELEKFEFEENLNQDDFPSLEYTMQYQIYLISSDLFPQITE